MIDLTATIAETLAAAGIDDPRREARSLIKAVTGTDPLLSDVADSDALQAAVKRRAAREPLSKIIGKREFYGRDFIVTDDVLDPRPDSETLIEAALAVLGEGDAILDLGTGSGCLILTLLAERPNATGVAVDISPEALAVARRNAVALGVIDRVAFVQTGFADFATKTPFDVVISNPPYIPSAECDTLEPEVIRHDPRLALDGGPDGCDPYHVILKRLAELMVPQGHFFLEFSPDICDNVVALARQAGHDDITVMRDLAGRERVMTGRCG